MTTNKPEASHLAGARAEFEAWITSPPYEKPVTINPDSSGWPGQYRAYEVQLAWEAYQSGRAESALAAPPPAEQQPAVTQLREALTMARETIAAALRANAPDYFTTDADIARHVVIQRIDTALAAYRRETKT